MFTKGKILLSAFLLFSIAWWVSYALTNNQKGAILDNFKEKQYDLLFESNLWDFSSEFSDIFDISKKVSIYSKKWDENQEERHELEEKNEELLDKITSLELSVKQLDIDIKIALLKVDKINKKIITTKREKEINEKTIADLNKKVSENMETLLEYMVYIYKKTNTAYEKNQIDNLKSILLNGEDISDMINDLYFKWLIQITWKKLVDNHRKYVSQLYLKKVELEKQEENLKKLRKMWIIEKKVLSDKKDFKERLLEVSKWQQKLYEDYVKDKLNIEKNMILKSFKEKLKFNNVRDSILKKYNCEFVDVSKNTAEVRALRWKCLDINKMIYSESKLKKADTEGYNFEYWPVYPDTGITAYFHDKEYKKDFWSEHDAIDIAIEQGTPIRAPADWYVVYIEEPDSQDYAYIALKHHDWYMTVYGHISDVLVDEFDYVKAWEVFAQTGWEFGTFGAWFMTTWPHLHFEVFRDREYVDPLTVLDLSHIQFTRVPEKYKIKFYSDFKLRRWYEFKNKTEKSRVFVLKWDNEIERQKYMLEKYAVGTFNDWQMWVDEALDWNVDPSFAMCIWLAETTLWKYLKTPFNIWNIWNTDSWDTKTFPNARSWVYWMIKTLNNRYLWQYNELRLLSRYWNHDPRKPIYASSPDNWHRNIVKCLSHLKWTYVPDNFNFRLTE